MEVSGTIKAKSGKQFSIMKVSDLVKYDMSKVRKLLEIMAPKPSNVQMMGGVGYTEVSEFVKVSEKSFNTNGYKSLKVMAFQEAATQISKLTIGTVIGLLNPKPMKS